VPDQIFRPEPEPHTNDAHRKTEANNIAAQNMGPLMHELKLFRIRIRILQRHSIAKDGTPRNAAKCGIDLSNRLPTFILNFTGLMRASSPMDYFLPDCSFFAKAKILENETSRRVATPCYAVKRPARCFMKFLLPQPHAMQLSDRSKS
jgi:hypothetical protein